MIFAVKNPQDRQRMIEALENKADFPFIIKIEKGEPRSLRQNRLIHKWYAEIADQKKDHTSSQIEALCKWHFGRQILSSTDAEYAAKMDAFFAGRTYEQQVEMMEGKWSLPVTSLMTVKQMSEYLDAVQHYAAKSGIVLTNPEGDLI